MRTSSDRTLLTIEDDDAVRRSIVGFFEDKGFVVREAVEGTAGLEVFRSEKPDIVLTDLRLPGMDGLEILAAVREESPETPVIIFSGAGDMQDVIKALRTGACDYVTKPVMDLEDLGFRVNKAIEHADLFRENCVYRNRLEQLVDERTKELREANQAISAIVRSLIGITGQPCFDRITTVLCESLHADGALIGEFDSNKSSMRSLSVFLDGRHVPGYVYLVEGSPCEEIIRTRELCIYAEGVSRSFPDHCNLADLPIEGYAGAPIIGSAGEVMGVICVFSRTPLSLPPHGREIIETIAVKASAEVERRVADSERTLLTTAVEQVAEAIVISNPKGIIQYVNPALERMSGYTRDEIIGRHVSIFDSGKNDRSYIRAMRDTIGRGEVFAGHFVDRKKDGAIYEVEATISPVRDQSGQVVSHVAVNRDITKEMALQAQLRQAQKMEAIGTLAGGIAHDFNNILSGIIGYGEILQLFHIHESDPARSDLDQILIAGYRAKDLVQQILTFSRQTEKEKKAVLISPVVKEVVKLLRASLPSTIEIRYSVADEFARAMADPVQIHQVLMNLCTNAAYAMKKRGGLLEIELNQVSIGEHTAEDLPDLAAGVYLELTVHDTGCGMDRNVVEKIFDPYFSTKEKGEGTGLGLAVVHGIVMSYGGAITVESAPGQGSTFRVLLPKLMYEPAATPADHGELPLPTGDERILVIDDEPSIAEMVGRMLGRLGYDVTVRTSGMEAFDLFLSQPNRFDLVITDLTMPHVTGVELAEKMVQVRPELPIILCSGFGMKVSREAAASVGIREFLEKPASARTLAETVRKILDKGR